MRRGLFITGTDTGVGKTVTSAALLLRYRSAAPLRYWKPVQTGIEQDDDTREVQRLTGCQAADGLRLRHPVSPHLAARRSGVTIETGDLLRMLPAESGDAWIVEGAGGVLVPLNDRDLMIDLMQALALPVVVVARSSLGTINHTLLTLEALRARSLPIAGVVISGPRNPDNREAIERYGRIAVIGELPPLSPLDAATLGPWAGEHLDPQGRLLESLR